MIYAGILNLNELWSRLVLTITLRLSTLAIPVLSECK